MSAKRDESGHARRDEERSLDSPPAGLARDSLPSQDVEARFEKLLRFHAIL